MALTCGEDKLDTFADGTSEIRQRIAVEVAGGDEARGRKGRAEIGLHERTAALPQEHERRSVVPRDGHVHQLVVVPILQHDLSRAGHARRQARGHAALREIHGERAAEIAEGAHALAVGLQRQQPQLARVIEVEQRRIRRDEILETRRARPLGDDAIGGELEDLHALVPKHHYVLGAVILQIAGERLCPPRAREAGQDAARRGENSIAVHQQQEAFALADEQAVASIVSEIDDLQRPAIPARVSKKLFRRIGEKDLHAIRRRLLQLEGQSCQRVFALLKRGRIAGGIRAAGKDFLVLRQFGVGLVLAAQA